MYAFSKEEMAIDPTLGYPRAYAKLCKDTSIAPFTNAPPFTFTPYSLQPNQASRAKELDEMFPIMDPEAKPTSKTRIFISILWKQLNHLGNAGFDPAIFRVDPYGNVLYFHADSASPLAWAIDHWFPCSRGGLTVPGNLRILQWQVCKRKQKQLEFLVPWWDLQLGISINQFLSIFASVNSDFRHRAFRWLFSAGENEELNDLQTVASHNFPQPFLNSKEQLGLAPAAIVLSRRASSDASTLRSIDLNNNRHSRPNTPTIIAARKFKDSGLKENEMPDMVTNPYQAIVMARDSLKQRDETNKMKMEIQRLDDEVNEFKLKNEEEQMTIQELELALIKRRRRAEKCRKLADAQSAHRAMLQKMITNAMHQSVVYKEQLRLNQAASNTLMARLEAQIALCNTTERELHTKFKQKDELEKQIRPQLEQARKRTRTEDDDAVLEEKEDRRLIYLPRIRSTKHLHKELRAFLEEEQKLSEAALSMIEEDGNTEENTDNLQIVELENPDVNIRFPFAKNKEVEEEEDEESRKKRGKCNVEKWMQILLESTGEEEDLSPVKPAETAPPAGTSISKTDEIIRMLNEKYPQKDIKVLRLPSSTQNPRSVSTPRGSISCETDRIGKGGGGGGDIIRKSLDKNDKGKGIARCESARTLRHFPSSPSKILNMGKGVDCLRKKPLVFDDEDQYADENRGPSVHNNILRSPFKIIKKAVKS